MANLFPTAHDAVSVGPACAGVVPKRPPKAFAVFQVRQNKVQLYPPAEKDSHLSSLDFSFQSVCYYVFVQNSQGAPFLHFALIFFNVTNERDYSEFAPLS